MSEKNWVAPEYTVIVKGGYRYLEPMYIPPSGAIASPIFTVREPNAVGTLNYFVNGAVYLKFAEGKKEPEVEVIAKDYSKNVFGPKAEAYRFCPNFTGGIIAYSKTRTAVIIDLKTGDVVQSGFNIGMDDYMMGIRLLDPQRKLFVVVKAVEGRENETDPWFCHLHIARLEGSALVDLGEVMPHVDRYRRPWEPHLSYNNWVVHDRKIVAYDAYRSKEMLSFDGDLNKAAHPFAEIFNRNKGRVREIRDFVIHPELPFGFIAEHFFPSVEERKVLAWADTYILPDHILRWNTDDPDEQFSTINDKVWPLIKLLGLERLTFSYPSFSPDGKWLALGCFSSNIFTNPHFIAVPVDPERPDFLDFERLVVLGQVDKAASMAWSTAPVSFIVSNSIVLHKWNLEDIDKARVITVPDPDSGGGGTGVNDDDEEEEDYNYNDDDESNLRNEKTGILKRIGLLFRKDGGGF